MEFQTNYIFNDFIDELVLKSKNPRNSLSIKIPFTYASNLVHLNWNDLFYAIENEYFDTNAAIEFASMKLANDEQDDKVLELACLNSNDITKVELFDKYLVNFIDTVSKKEKTESKDKILYIILTMLFQNKSNFEDPYRVIEIIYDDFDFPKSMQGFVRYLSNSSIISTEELDDRWSEFLNEQKNNFAAR